MLVAVGACGDGTPELVSARVIITNVQLSGDGSHVESINVRTREGKELSIRLSEEIDPRDWSPIHLQGHVQGGKLGIQIGVRYIETSDGKVAMELVE